MLTLLLAYIDAKYKGEFYFMYLFTLNMDWAIIEGVLGLLDK